MNEIFEILCKIRPEANYRGSSDYLADGLLDSFDIVMLVANLDIVFGISISGSDITPDNFRNAESIAVLVSKQLHKP